MMNNEKIIDELMSTVKDLGTLATVVGMMVKEIKEGRFSTAVFTKKLESLEQKMCFNDLKSKLAKVGMDDGQIQRSIGGNQQEHKREVDKYIGCSGNFLESLLEKLKEKGWDGSDTCGLADE